MSADLLRSVRITHPQKRFLEFLAERGGEIPWDWRKVERPDARAMVTGLINQQLVVEREYETSSGVVYPYLRLGDMGRALVARLEASTRKAPIVTA